MSVIDYAGEDNLMVGTDYRHADYSDDIEAIQTFARVGKNEIESVITRRSAEQMKLKKGDKVTVVIKSTEVVLEKG